jgi:hypothetical protein
MAAQALPTTAFKKLGTAVGTLKKASLSAGTGLLKMGKAALPLLGKAGALGVAAAGGYMFGKLLREKSPVIAQFGDALGEGVAKLLGFKGAVSDAEAAQGALNNKSEGVAKAIRQVTEGITSDYEKDSFKHMVAVRQLQGMREEDLRAYAKKVASTGKLDEEEAMQRLKQLQSEKVDNAKFMEARREALGEAAKPVKKKDEAAGARKRKAVVDAGEPAVSKMTPEERVAMTQQIATELSPKMLELAGPLFERMSTQSGEYYQNIDQAAATHYTTMTDLARSFWEAQLPAMAIDAWNRVGAAFEQRLGVPTTMPMPGGTARAGGALGARPGAGAIPRTGGATVMPDGTIRLNVMIPRDALEQSNTQSAGYAE